MMKTRVSVLVAVTIAVFAYTQKVSAAEQTICSNTFTFTGSWTDTAAGACNHLNYSSATGSTFTVKAKTTRVRLDGRSLALGGVLDIFMNGHLVAKVDTYNAYTFEGIIYDSGDMPYGDYTIVGIVEAKVNSAYATPVAGSVQVFYLLYEDSTPTVTPTLVPSATPTLTPTVTPTSTPVKWDLRNNKDSQVEYNFWMGLPFFFSGDWLIYIVWLLLFPTLINSNYPVQVYTVFFFVLYMFYIIVKFVRDIADRRGNKEGLS